MVLKKPGITPATLSKIISQIGVVLVDKKEIEQALRDYRWMIKEIQRQREMLSHYETKVTAQTGIEAVMPKAKGITSDPVALEVIRRDKKSQWVEKLEQKVLFIQKRISIITDEREKAVLNCMLDGMSMKAIGQHMGLSRTHIYNIKESIIEQFVHFGHIEHSERKMTV